MNPDALILRSLSHPDLSPELRAIVVDYLSGVRSEDLAEEADLIYDSARKRSVDEAVSALIWNLVGYRGADDAVYVRRWSNRLQHLLDSQAP